ncbi:hypothetical protein [Streptomyces indicus]|uniref:Uncharacterized protein n=1 Tax=Streptomyces indicus TaxID=417292 RepID=A0A1G8VVE7_9ACTN|nr:hypothetical protein [Streptomyces indicus]SDJ69200.1 hypothetical protein SAMN05421806_10222 [Streptomyces indicus]
MSDDNQPQPAAEPKASSETPKELTPEEYGEKYEAAQDARSADIHAMHNISDAFTKVQEMFPFGGGSPGGAFGRTNFDETDLNAMLDLLEQAKPSEIEDAGNALIKAKDKLNEAAEELDQYVTKVDWKGEGAEEFRRFGRALAQHAWSIGSFANSAGTQMQTASTGLASVLGARPPRDDRPVEKRPWHFDAAEQVADNKEYQKALKSEENRQEAITQMNRLASFYAVSEEMLAGQKVPTFPEGLKAAVPPPSNQRDNPDAAMRTGAAASAASAAPLGRDGSEGAAGDTVQGVGATTPPPSRDVSMEIDSVAAPPAPTATTGSVPPSTTLPTGPSNGPVPPFAPSYTNTTQVGAGRPANSTGNSRPSPTTVRPTPAGTNPTTGRSPGITGRPTAIGPGGSSPGRAPSVGRPGIVGGTPSAKPAGTTGQTGPVGRAGTTGGIRAGNPNGIMGGSPQRGGGGSSSSRLPRGTVVGGPETSAGRGTTARPGRSGVIGSNASGPPRPTGLGTPSSNGIVGAPRANAPGRRPAGGSFTTGGTGLAGGRSGPRRPDEEEPSSTTRPDYLTEDEETWTPRRRDAVPPVID